MTAVVVTAILEEIHVVEDGIQKELPLHHALLDGQEKAVDVMKMVHGQTVKSGIAVRQDLILVDMDVILAIDNIENEY